MRETWRYFNEHDRITRRDLRQLELDGIVTSLYHVPPGALWEKDEIERIQRLLARDEDGAATGLSWEVVESLPVSEAIKTQSGPWRDHIETYKASLENLAQCGVETICYNFMPVLDWTRTALRHDLGRGAATMRFDLIAMAAFDIHLLARAGAEADYGDRVVREARAFAAALSDEQQRDLAQNIVAGLPGAAEHWTLESVRAQLEAYRGIDEATLRRHLIAFLEEVAPTAQRLGLRLCCHPDDPPFSLLGLPRIMSTAEDYRAVLEAVDLPSNGVTLCSGSFGATARFDFEAFVERFGARIHFLHLRNTRREALEDRGRCSFYESGHVEGDTDMIGLLRAIRKEERRRERAGQRPSAIPMRPDHGLDMLSDLGAGAMPGYPLIGRLRGLSELRGAIAAIDR